MYLSVMTYSFAQALRSGAMDTAAAVRCIAQLGVSAIELMDGFIPDQDVHAVHAALAETACHVVCYDVGADFITPDRQARQQAITRVLAGIERAAFFGAPTVLVVPGVLKEHVSPAVARAWIVEGLRACVPQAARYGVTLNLEDHSSQAAVYGRSNHLNAMADAVGPYLKVTYDVGNFVLAGEDALIALDCLRGRLVHVHLKDWHRLDANGIPGSRGVMGLDGRRYVGAVLGDGMVDVSGAVAALRHHGYTGALSVEYEGTDDPLQAVPRAVSYAHQQLQDLACASTSTGDRDVPQQP